MRIFAAVLVAGTMAGAVVQQPRDGQRLPARAGTAVVAGVVHSADAPRRPVRRARVLLHNATMTFALAAITDDEGRYRLEQVPAGRYTFEVTKEAYLTSAFGASAPGRPGRQIVIADGERRDVPFVLQRGAVLEGLISDGEGQPIQGAPVEVYRRLYTVAGERVWVPVSPSATVTNDRGEYRIFGLPPADYAIQARAGSGPGLPAIIQSPGEVRTALAALGQQKAGVARVPGMPPPPPPLRLPPGPPPRTVNYAPVFYPGTTDRARARIVTVGAAEERRGLDFTIDHVPTAAISGIVAGPYGTRGVTIRLLSAGDTPEYSAPGRISRVVTLDAEGRFTAGDLPPGAYTLTARQPPSPESPGSWASASILVDGDDVDGVALVLQPGLVLSGRLVFDGAPAPAALGSLRTPLPLTPAAPGPAGLSPTVQTSADGRFRVANLVPGEFFPAPGQSLSTPVGGWWLQSILMGGREWLDGPLEIRRSADDVVVTFANRASELTLSVTDGEGVPLAGHYLAVFSAAPAHWFPGSRRVQGTRLPDHGRHTIRNLPPGDYLVAVADDWWHVYDSEWLGRMAGRARRLTLGAYAREFRDIVVSDR